MIVPSVKFQPVLVAESGFEVVSLQSLRERAADLDHNPGAPHRIQFNALIYVSEGKGRHFIDFHWHMVNAGTFIFVRQNQVQAFDFDRKLQGHVLLYTQQFKDAIRSNIRLPLFFPEFIELNQTPVHTVNRSLQESCESLLDEIIKLGNEQEQNTLLTQLLFSSLILKLYSDVPASFSRQLTEAKIARFSSFLANLSQHYSTTREAGDYAEMLGMTYKSLNQLCKTAVAKTPKQLIDAHVILEAKRRLAISNLSVKQLAFDLGFDEVSNFTKYFKKHTLFTPKQFKNQTKG